MPERLDTLIGSGRVPYLVVECLAMKGLLILTDILILDDGYQPWMLRLSI